VISDAAVEANQVELTDEMSRRVGLDMEVGRRVLAAARLSSKGVDMKAVAWGIHRAAEMNQRG
jgi:hypothetical protein